MADLRRWLEEAGYGAVVTHLATGNVRLTSEEPETGRVADHLEQLLEERAGFDVPTVVVTPHDLTQVLADARALDVTATRRYVAFLRQEPDDEARARAEAWDRPGEGVRVVGRAAHWWLDHANQQARLSNAVLEKALGVATTRDLKVVATLAERWGC